MSFIDAKYFREYRDKLWFTNQAGVKSFFAAKDITPTVDYGYIDLLNERLCAVIRKIDTIVDERVKVHNIDEFCKEHIFDVSDKLRANNILPKLNNQWRRREEVYFSWMRGFVISSYFMKALSLVFGINIANINLIGDDDLVNIETFKRTPKADLEVTLVDGAKVRIEVQSWFQWTNDIKQHKVLEAKRIHREEGLTSLVVHFDLFNGQVAFVPIDQIEDDSVNRITRQQMEWQTVFNIEQNYFIRKLTELPPHFSNLDFYHGY